MEDASDDGGRLPVPVTAYGPLHLLAKRVHMLASTGRSPEALTAADAYLEIARTVGDERSVRFLVQGKMYAYLDMGRVPEAIDLGERLLAAHRAGGNVVEEAKTLCDLARMHVLRGRYVDGMLHLARAAVLLERRPARGDRHRSAMCSFAETATVAEMYETAATAYERLCAFDEPGRATSFDLVYATTLLYWDCASRTSAAAASPPSGCAAAPRSPAAGWTATAPTPVCSPRTGSRSRSWATWWSPRSWSAT